MQKNLQVDYCKCGIYKKGKWIFSDDSIVKIFVCELCHKRIK